MFYFSMMRTTYQMTAADFLKNNPDSKVMMDMLEKAQDENMFQNLDWSYFPIARGFGFDIQAWDRGKSITIPDAFNLLISDTGFSVNQVDVFRRSILMFATYNGYAGIVLMLLINGANVTKADVAGMSALTWATNGGREAVVNFLIQYRVPLNSQDRLNRTALHHALRRRDHKIAHLLVSAGGYLYSTDQLEGVLTWAPIHGYERITHCLLHQGIDPNESDGYGVTALMRATEGGQLGCVEKLVEYSAKLDATDREPRPKAQTGHLKLLPFL